MSASNTEVQAPRVEVFHRLDEITPYATALQTLNLGSRRPSPFLTPEYLAAYLAHDEFRHPGAEPLMLMAFDRTGPVGFLPLRRRPERVLGVSRERLEFLTTHDTDRPGLVALPGDEGRCAEAFVQHLTEVEERWSFLELMEQDDSSPLYEPPLDGRHFSMRRYPNNPNSTIVLEGSFEEWFQSLGSLRRHVANCSRKVWGAGRVAFWAGSGPDAAPRLFDLYLELEARSWKAVARAGIARHPERVELFRAMVGPGHGATPTITLLLVDEVPIAGMVLLEFAGTAYELELAYDEAFARLGPGNVVFMLAARQLFTRGLRTFNLMGNFAYYKSRWLARVTPTHAVQVFRNGSLHQLRARAGDLRRRLFGARRFQQDADHNLSKPKELPHGQVDRLAARALADNVSRELENAGAPMTRLEGKRLTEVLPFTVGNKGGSDG